MIDIDTGAGWEPEFSQGMGSTPITLTPYNTQTNKKNPRNTNFGSAIKKGKSLPPPPHTHSRGPLHPQLFIEALLEVIGYVSLHPICLTAKIFCTPSLETKYFVSEPSIICLHFCSICTCSYNRLSFSKENYNYFIFIRYDHGHLNVDFYDSETR